MTRFNTTSIGHVLALTLSKCIELISDAKDQDYQSHIELPICWCLVCSRFKH